MTHPSTPAPASVKKDEARLAAYALSLPEAVEEAPWGHRAFKVRNKTFLFLTASGEGLSLSTKLPISNAIALVHPFAEPTGYGLGRAGWISARFAPKERAPTDVLLAWIEESYRAIAPKKLVAQLDGAASPGKKPTSR